MLTGKFPGTRQFFDPIILQQAINMLNFPVQIYWNASRPPRSIFGKPSNPAPSNVVSNANHLSVFYNNVEIISAHSLKSGMGKIFVRDKILNQQQINLITSAFWNVGIQLKKPSEALAFSASVIHFILLFFITIIGFLANEIIFISIGMISLVTISLGIILVSVGANLAGIILSIFGIIFTAPSGLLQFPIINYLILKNEEKNPPRLIQSSF